MTREKKGLLEVKHITERNIYRRRRRSHVAALAAASYICTLDIAALRIHITGFSTFGWWCLELNG